MLHPCDHRPLPNQLHAHSLARLVRLFGWCTGLLGVVFCCIALSGCGSVTATSASTAATGTLVGSPATVNFGTVTVGQSASAKVSLLNQGPGSVEISKLTLAGQSFAFSGEGNLPVTLAAGSSLSLNVQFAPTAAGAVSDQLTVTSSSSTDPTPLVSLSGTGVAAAGTGSSTVSALSCTNSSMTGAGTDACTVTLTAAAGTGGLTVSLSSNNAAVTVPSSVTVAAGATSAGFTATVSAVSTTQTATLTATAGGTTQTFAITVDTPGLGLSASSLSFGDDTVNTTTRQTVTLTSSGNAPLTISAGSVTGTGFSMSGMSFPLTLNPGQTSSLTVQFDPTAAGAASGAVTLTSNAPSGGTATIGLSGTGEAAPGTLSGLVCSSGTMTGGGSDYCTATLTAAAGSGGLTVSLSSNNAAVTVPSSVAAAAGATSVSFTATVSAVSTTQTVTLTASAGGATETYALTLNAATAALTLGSSNVAFGDVNLNSPATQTVTLTSSGTANLTISAGSVTGTDFSMSGVSFPVTLDPGQTATLTVQFDPTAAGAASGAMTLTSNAPGGGTATISLSGTGQAAQYQVNLTWDAPTGSSDPVAGYNVYRAVSGSSTYKLLNSSPEGSTAYSDTGVLSSTSYIYFVESVDAEGNASVPSKTFTVSIP